LDEKFKRALAFVLRKDIEGGYVNDPRDPGGATNCGVTQTVYDEQRTKLKLPKQSVKFISKREIEDIYSTSYWTPARDDSFSSNLSLTLFDYAVNAGVKRAVRALQLAAGTCPDGEMGPKTVEATQAAMERYGEKNLIDKINTTRNNHYMRLGSTAKYKPFLKGWLNRLAALKRELAL